MAKVKRDNGFGHFIGNIFRNLFTLIWFIIRIPYWLVLGIMWIFRKAKGKAVERAVEKKREKMKANYSKMSMLKSKRGDFSLWENNLFDSDSKIGIILGARGSGKSAFGMKVLENVHVKKGRKCFALGFKEESMPSWIKVVNSVDELENNSFVLIDEAGISFSSRSSMSSANKLLSDLILVARHKNLSILFISQNSSNLDVNILRQADYLVLKPSSLLQKDFERKIIQDMYTATEKEFEKFADRNGLTYIYSNDFTGFVENELPSFWSEGASKGFR